jgi:hypothetical protein
MKTKRIIHPSDIKLIQRVRPAAQTFLITLLSLNLFFSCSLFGEKKQATLKLNLSFDTSLPTMDAGKKQIPTNTQKNITPTEPWTPSKYSVSGKGPGGIIFFKDSSNPRFVATMDPGTWDLDIRALSAAGKALASRTISAKLDAGKINTIGVTLLPEKGAGSLLLNIVRNFASETDYNIEGNLTFLGLPGQTTSTPPLPIPLLVTPDQNSISIDSLTAGYYTLNLKLKRPDGTIAGGMADTVLILAAYNTSGTCTISAGQPGIDFSFNVYPFTPLLPAVMSVDHASSMNRPFIPVGLVKTPSPPDSGISSQWYFNGEQGDVARKILGNRGVLPENSYGCFPSLEILDQTLVRADLVMREDSSMRAGSSSSSIWLRNEFKTPSFGWRGMYDFKSATSLSVFGKNPLTDAGTGVKADVRAVASSKDGLIIISGMDKDNAIHAFATAAQAELDYSGDEAPYFLPVETSWIRLWRDEIKINGSARNADRVAISKTSGYIALSSSASNWLRVYALDTFGRIIGIADYCAPMIGEKPEFSDFRGLCFSENGERLYVLSNNQEAIHVFSTKNVASGNLEYLSKYSFDELCTESLSMQDLKLSNDSTLIATSSEASKIYLFEDIDGSLLLLSTIERTLGDINLYKPSCVAVSHRADRFYVLANGTNVLAYEKSPQTGCYSFSTSYPVPAGAQSASLLSLGDAAEGNINPERLCVAGGYQLGIIFIGENGVAALSEGLAAETDDSSGITDSCALSYTRGGFLLGGRKTGTVSLFACTDEN